MKKSDLSKKYEKLKIENKLYKEEIDNLKRSRIFRFVQNLPKKIRFWLLEDVKKTNKILEVKEELIDTLKGKITIIINVSKYKESISYLLKKIIMQRYINYDIILVGKESNINKYVMNDSRILTLFIENNADIKSILNGIYKMSNSDVFCYINGLSYFDDRFLLDNIECKYDIKFICEKSDAQIFAMFIKKSKVKSFINNRDFDIKNMNSFSNIKIKWINNIAKCK